MKGLFNEGIIQQRDYSTKGLFNEGIIQRRDYSMMGLLLKAQMLQTSTMRI